MRNIGISILALIVSCSYNPVKTPSLVNKQARTASRCDTALYDHLIRKVVKGNELNRRPHIAKKVIQNFAFCACMMKHKPDYDAKMNDGSLAGYSAIAEVKPFVLDSVYAYAIKYPYGNYPSSDCKDLVLMRCLDFYNSDDLNNYINDLLDTIPSKNNR